MLRGVVALTVLAGCGRVGFGDAPAACSEVPAGAPSGTYLLASGAHVYCDMATSGGGWTRVADVDAANGCPGEWARNADPAACFAKTLPVGGGTRSAEFPSPVPYSEVMGNVEAYQYGSCDAFGDGPGTIDSRYVDGLSITYRDAGARKHVWTYACAWSNYNFAEPYHLCPCQTGGTQPPPWVGSSYVCASGHNDAIEFPPSVWYTADPLFDGKTQGTGCDTGGTFVIALDTLTESPLEARLMLDQAADNEDLGVYRMQLFVR